MSYTISFFLGSKASKSTTIYAKVHYAGTSYVKASTGTKINPKHWVEGKRKQKTYAVRGTGSESLINETIKQVERKLNALFAQKALENYLPTVEEVKEAIKHHDEKEIPKSFREVKQIYLDQCSIEMSAKSKANIENSLVNVLEAFEQHQGKPITFQGINSQFSTEFKKYLIGRRNPTYYKYKAVKLKDNRYKVIKAEEALKYQNAEITNIGLLNDTINKHFSFLKTFLKWAKDNSYTNETGHNTLKPPTKSTEQPVILTRTELEQIEQYAPPESKQYLQRIKDLFLVSIYTGQRISDLREFHKSQLKYEANGVVKWCIKPYKVRRLQDKQVEIPLIGWSHPALEIFKKYNYQLPRISNQKYNDYLKELCKLAGINEVVRYSRWSANIEYLFEPPKYEVVSSHTGRRTFCSLLLTEGAPAQNIMQITGHSDYKTFSKYIGTDTTRLETHFVEMMEKSSYTPMRAIK